MYAPIAFLHEKARTLIVNFYQANARARRAGRPLSNEEKKELRVLTASFRAFLVDAMAFYLRFITRLRKHFDLSEVEEIVLKQLDTDIESASRY